MKIESSSDLIYWTYFMLDWSKVSQTPSDQKCLQCGGPMNSVEPATDKKGRSYEGLVCHNCKQLIWFKKADS